MIVPLIMLLTQTRTSYLALYSLLGSTSQPLKRHEYDGSLKIREVVFEVFSNVSGDYGFPLTPHLAEKHNLYCVEPDSRGFVLATKDRKFNLCSKRVACCLRS